MAFAFIIAGIVALLGIRLFVKFKDISLHELVPLFLAIYIPCSIVVLVPIDLMSSSQLRHPLFYISEEVRLVLWRVSYWLAFLLTWAILPILQSYTESGYYDPFKKTLDALRQNARYQMILLGSGLAGLLYMILTSRLSLTSLKALVIALSHCYALVLAIWLLGHGMVNIPRSLWHGANPQARLFTNYRNATKVCDAYAENEATYHEISAEINSVAPYKQGRYVEWIDNLLDEVSNGPVAFNNTVRPQVTVERAMINEQYLANLSRRFKRAKCRLIRCRADWQKLLKDCSIAEDILNSAEERSLVFRYSRTRLPPKFAYFYYTRIHTWIVQAWATLLAGMSVILVWSELTHGTRVSVVNIIVSASHGIVQQFISSLFLGYMCISAFVSLTRIRIFNIYALVYHGSDVSSLLFYAMYACRLTVPLSFNYINLISSRESVFEEFLGKSINLTPLGKYFNDWLPRLIIIPVALTLFHFYDRIKDFLGFGFAFDDEDENGNGPGSVVEGRELVKRALTDVRFRFAYESPETVGAFLTSTRTHSPLLRPVSSTINNSSQNLGSSLGIPASRRLGSPTSIREEGNTGFKVLNNIKSFFGNVGSSIEDGISNIREGNSNLARWMRLNNGDDEEDVLRL